MKAKYIVYEHMPGDERIVIFPETVQHAEAHNPQVGRIIAAGFICFRKGEFLCWDESISLGIASRHGTDADLANEMFGMGG